MKRSWFRVLMLTALLASAFPVIVSQADGNENSSGFMGTVESLPSTQGWIGDWRVGGRTVHVTAATRLEQEHGAVAVGAYVKVEGQFQADGSVNAAKIEVKQGSGGGNGDGGYIKFYGTVSSLPGTPGWIGNWVVGGRSVRISAATRIEQTSGPVAVGAYVEVEGNQLMGGIVDATRIEVKQGSGGESGGYIKFYGTVSSLPNTTGWVGDWIVDGRTVHVTSATRIEQDHGTVGVGAYVEIEGNQRADNSVDATMIEVERSPGGGGSGNYIEFYGTIASLPNTPNLIGDWVVGTRTVHVSSTTQIMPMMPLPVVGAYVEVEGNQRADGSIDAVRIEIKHGPNGAGSGSYIEVHGTIGALPSTAGWIGDWQVAGRTVHVTTSTLIEQMHGAIALGAYVEVKGNQRADGSIDAIRIEVRSSPRGGASPMVEFFGPVENLPTTAGLIGTWQVGGRTVYVTATTRIEGAVAVGTVVEVKGWLQADASINATKIEVKSPPVGGSILRFYSVIESLPATPGWIGDWRVGGRTVHVTAATRIEQGHGQVVVGAYVEVAGSPQADGSINATSIEVKSNTSASVDAAGYARGGAKGQILAAFGTGFPATTSLTASAQSVPLPTQLGTVSVRVNGIAAPLFFAGVGGGFGVGGFQINYQLPFETEPGLALVEVLDDGLPVASEFLTVNTVGPGVFTISANGQGQAVALNQDYTLNGDPGVNPQAKLEARGRIIIVFANGQGDELIDFVTRQPLTLASGTATPASGSLLYATAKVPAVTIGGVPATVVFSGLTPGLVSLWQLNIVIPENAPTGNAVPLAITIEGRTSNITNIAVK